MCCVGPGLTWNHEVPCVTAICYYHSSLHWGRTRGLGVELGADWVRVVDGGGRQLAENERVGIRAVPHVVVVVQFGQMWRCAVRGDRGVAAVLVWGVG